MALSDRETIIKIKEGEIEYFRVIVNKYTRTIYGYFKKRLSIKEDAEDLTQNCFIKFYKNIDKFDEDKEVSPYLVQIAKNELKMFYRQKKPTLPLNEEMASKLENRTNFNEDYLEIINSLPKKQAKILNLLSEGFSYREIADKMNKPLNTIKTIIRRLRLKIKKNKK